MRKILLLIFFIPFINFSQVQIGENILGENTGTRFGHSVSLSSDGSTLAASAIFNGSGESPGLVRIYENQEGNWIQIGDDIDGQTGDQLGTAISLSSDGSIIAIGAEFGEDNNGVETGIVRIYENQGNNWVQIGTDIFGDANNDRFGSSVSLSSDGSILAIGAINSNVNGSHSGQVKIYENQGGNWIQRGQDINGNSENELLGYSLDISQDGNTLAIGVVGLGAGQVQVFNYQNNNWIQKGQNINGVDSSDDFFGNDVSISSDGNILAIGTEYSDLDINGLNYINIGKTSIYRYENNIWTQIGDNIYGEITFSTSRFGQKVSLSSDGNLVAISGKSNSSLTQSGYVRLYYNNQDTWTQIGQQINGIIPFDYFGESLNISSDGYTISIGAPSFLNNTQTTGIVQVYGLNNILSVEDLTTSSFNIYPNPTKSQFTIQLENPSDFKNANIYNSLGQLVLSSKETTIDTSKLASGLYVVELETTKGKGSKKLIIK